MKKSKILRFFAMIFTVVTVISMMCPSVSFAEEEGFKVILDPNGGTCETESLTTKTDGTLEVLPYATRVGYRFDGWYTEPEGGEYVFVTSHVFDIDTTLFAHWSYKSDPVITSPKENQVIKAKVGDTVTFSVDVEFADEIKWFLNKNDGGDILPVEEDFFTTVTIENITESYEGYVYYCEISNENTPEDAIPLMSPSFTIDIEGVEKDYHLPEPEVQDEGLSDGAVIAIVVIGIVVVSVVAAVITNIISKKNKK